jgi:hypothetical protein
VNIATSAGIALSVLALTIAVGPVETWKDAQQQAAARVPSAVLERYVGEYVSQDGTVSFKVVVEGATLFQEGSGRRTAYAPLSETLFMWGPVFTAEFVIDQAGGVTQILSNGTGIENRFRRKGSPPEPPATSAAVAAAVRVPRPVLERYVGVYEFVPGQMSRTDLRIFVRLEGDTLIREGAGPTSILTPISETRFKVGSTSAMVEFMVDEFGVMQVLGSGFQQSLARLTSKR